MTNQVRKHQFFAIFFAMSLAFAGTGLTTYQAKIVKPDGYPLEANSVNFRFTILNPAGQRFVVRWYMYI